jgi:hypothetical protein
MKESRNDISRITFFGSYGGFSYFGTFLAGNNTPVFLIFFFSVVFLTAYFYDETAFCASIFLFNFSTSL